MKPTEIILFPFPLSLCFNMSAFCFISHCLGGMRSGLVGCLSIFYSSFYLKRKRNISTVYLLSIFLLLAYPFCFWRYIFLSSERDGGKIVQVFLLLFLFFHLYCFLLWRLSSHFRFEQEKKACDHLCDFFLFLMGRWFSILSTNLPKNQFFSFLFLSSWSFLPFIMLNKKNSSSKSRWRALAQQTNRREPISELWSCLAHHHPSSITTAGPARDTNGLRSVRVSPPK